MIHNPAKDIDNDIFITSWCCDAPPAGEVDDKCGVCSQCGDHAIFVQPCSVCEGVGRKDNVICLQCQGKGVT